MRFPWHLIGDAGPQQRGTALEFADSCRRALEGARSEALRLRHEYVGTEHILLGLTLLPTGEGSRFIAALGPDVGLLRTRVLESCRPGTGTAKRSRGSLPYTSRAKRALEGAMAEGRALGVETVTPELMVLGLLRDEKGLAGQVMRAMGATLDAARAALRGESWATGAQFRITVDDTSEMSFYEQIIAQVHEAIATSALLPGARLPAVRQLADELGIAPGTVARAYAELERQGAVVTEGARGTRVAPRERSLIADGERPTMLVGLLRPVAVAAFHLGASADELRRGLEEAMGGIFNRTAS